MRTKITQRVIKKIENRPWYLKLIFVYGCCPRPYIKRSDIQGEGEE